MIRALPITRRRRFFSGAAALVLVVSFAVLRTREEHPASPPVQAEPAQRVEAQALRLGPSGLAQGERGVQKSRPKPKPKPSLIVEAREFRIRDIRTEADGYRATIHGAVWHERRGVIAQPLLRYELRDRDGALLRAGEFTPSDAAGPLWVGFGFDGLKAIPFRLDLDLRPRLPGPAPRAPFSATVRPFSVIDARAR